jgi:predicted AAA+ superfamily ATPase
MIPRTLKLPSSSFFLFGPRGTGKSTWLKALLGNACWYDLLKPDVLLRLKRSPGLLRKEAEALPEGSWIVLDEIQLLPELLNEVQSLMTDHPGRYRFAISGSSARKLKRLGANLLAGRAVNKAFFPLTAQELGFSVDVEILLRYGCLPLVVTDPQNAISTLEAYTANYLQQEIQQEALAYNLDAFFRFLEIAAHLNGRVVNIANVARDTGVAQRTAMRYFDVLEQTLIGCWLPAWRPRAKVKEVAHPKFYLFDTGVIRAIAGTVRDPLQSEERGFLLESYLLHEIRAYQNIADCGGKLSYWGTPSLAEIDFIWTRGPHTVGIEVKAATTWRSDSGNALKSLVQEGKIAKAFGVFLGPQALVDGTVEVYPLKEFLTRLYQGSIIG